MRHRQAKVKIYRKTARYPFYRIAYRAEGRRRVRSFKTYGEARREAARIAKQIAKGKEAVAVLTPRDALAYRFALDKLAQLSAELNVRKAELGAPDIAFSLEDAITEYAEAKLALGQGRLREAVEGYRSTVAQVRRVPVRKAVDEYLSDRQRLTVPREPGMRPTLSPKLHYQERLRLDRFVAAFVMDVCDLTRDHLDLFFREHLHELSPKSRNHYRGTLRQWIRFCLNRDYLPTNHQLERSSGLCPDGKRQERPDDAEIEIYTPKEFATLLAKAEEPLQVLIAIGGLAGLRTQELLRLEWSDLWCRPGYIEVGRAKAKTRQRRLVPIGSALAAWLAPWTSNTQGRLWEFKENEFHVRFRDLCAAAGVERKDNALRHGFISYRLAQTQNEHVVAQEGGTSPTMIHRHYRELVTPAEAKEWFAVMPAGAASNPGP